MRRASLLVLASVLAGLTPEPAGAFSAFRTFFSSYGQVDVQKTILESPRWSAEPVDGAGLHDRITVGIEADIALTLGVKPEEVPQVRQALVAAFEAWSSEVLQFDVTFDADLEAEEYEIEVATWEGRKGLGELFGYAQLDQKRVADRLLTNGQRHDGWVITAARLMLNAANVRWFRREFKSITTDEALLDALQKLVMHEAGHTIGLGHPTIEEYTLDTDDDPLNPMPIDPFAPWTGLRTTQFPDSNAIMSGLPYGASFESLFETELHNDDIAGRDALYPVAPSGLEVTTSPDSDLPDVDFGEGVVGATGVVEVILTNWTDDPVVVESVKIKKASKKDRSGAHDDFRALHLDDPSLPLENLEIASGESLTLPVGFSPTDRGPRGARLLIVSSGFVEDEGDKPKATLHLSGVGLDPLRLSTDEIRFGKVAKKVLYEESFSITNRSTAPIDVRFKPKKVDPGYDLSDLQPTTLAPGRTEVFPVRFRGRSKGKAVGKVIIQSPDGFMRGKHGLTLKAKTVGNVPSATSAERTLPYLPGFDED